MMYYFTAASPRRLGTTVAHSRLRAAQVNLTAASPRRLGTTVAHSRLRAAQVLFPLKSTMHKQRQ